jgi:hypothetical protein
MEYPDLNQLTTKSSLSTAQIRLVELFQIINFGRVERLHFRGGQPIFDPPPRVTKKLKMGAENGPRPESSMHDFVLKVQTVDLLETISKIGDGQILVIEVKNGLAFSVEIEHSVEEEGHARSRL